MSMVDCMSKIVPIFYVQKDIAMCFLLYLLIWTTVESLNPMRSEGTVPPDTLWHIKMMSPPLSNEMTIRKPFL